MGDVSEISCIDDIFYKKDVSSLRELCKRWGVDVAGCRDIKDIKKLLMKHYLGQNKTGATEVRVCSVYFVSVLLMCNAIVLLYFWFYSDIYIYITFI